MCMSTDQWRCSPSARFRPGTPERLSKGIANSISFRHHPRGSHGSETQGGTAIPHVLHPHGHVVSQYKINESTNVSSHETHRRPHAHTVRAISRLATWNHSHSCMVPVSLFYARPASQFNRLGYYSCWRVGPASQSDCSGANQLDGCQTTTT